MCIKHRNDWYLHQKEHDYWLWTLNTGSIFILNLLFWNKMMFKTWSVCPQFTHHCGKMWVVWKMQIWFVQGSFGQVSNHSRVPRLLLQGSWRVRGGSGPEADWKAARLLWSDQHPGEDQQGEGHNSKTGRKKTLFCLNFVIYNAEKAGIQIGRGEVWDLWK